MDTLEIIAWSLFGLIILVAILTVYVQKTFQKRNAKFALKQSSKQKTGAEVARMILAKNNITGVKIILGKEGQDHFNPKSNTIALSPSVFNSSSVSAMAIAAHECGHAIQWSKRSIMIRVRDAILAPVNIASQIGSMMMSMGLIILLFNGFGGWILWITFAGIILYSATGLFQLVTLPIEFDASKKAKRELAELELMTSETDIQGTKSVLNSAAMTYVVTFLSTALILALFIVRLIAMSRR